MILVSTCSDNSHIIFLTTIAILSTASLLNRVTSDPRQYSNSSDPLEYGAAEERGTSPRFDPSNFRIPASTVGNIGGPLDNDRGLQLA